MADGVHPTQPIPPGTRVAVFGAYEPSATGVGYFGTLVSVDEASMRRWPGNPERWQYVVNFPRFGKRCLVQAIDLLVVAEVDGDTKLDCAADSVPADWLWKIRFNVPIGEDNTDVRGRYRMASRERGAFHFQKREAAAPRYQFRMNTSQGKFGRGLLLYTVPTGTVLDRRFVVRALAEVLRSP